jgi:hypothetical protein
VSIHRYQSTWRSITFNAHLDNSGLVDDPAHLVAANIASRYTLDTCDINRVSVQDYRELRQFLEGAEPNEAFEGVRAINGQGRIQGASAGDLEDKAWALNEAFSVAACRIAAQATTPKGVLPFSFRRDHLVAGVLVPMPLRFYARPGPGRPVWVGRRQEGFARPFSFQLIAFDPFAYDEAATNVLLAGATVVTNPGNVYVRPVVTIVMAGNGSATFTLTNSTTGKALVLDLSAFGAGTLVIDAAASSIIKSSDSSDQYSRRVSGYISDMFLLAGANTVTGTNLANVTSITYGFRGAWA